MTDVHPTQPTDERNFGVDVDGDGAVDVYVNGKDGVMTDLGEKQLAFFNLDGDKDGVVTFDEAEENGITRQEFDDINQSGDDITLDEFLVSDGTGGTYPAWEDFTTGTNDEVYYEELIAQGFTDEQIEEMGAYDTDGSGGLSETEYAAYINGDEPGISFPAFSDLDTDGNGTITRDELENLGLEDEYIDMLMGGDTDGSDGIDVSEYEAMKALIQGSEQGNSNVPIGFDQLDTDGVEGLSEEEITAEGNGLTNEEVATVLAADTNDDGVVDESEYAAAFADAPSFDGISTDSNELLSEQELSAAGFTQGQIDAMMDYYDESGDGQISQEEYTAYIGSEDFPGMVMGDYALYNDIDTSGDGALSDGELQAAGYTTDQIDEMKALDGQNGGGANGQVGRREYELWVATQTAEAAENEETREDMLAERGDAPRIADINADGVNGASRDELSRAGFTQDQIDTMMAEYDENGDGKISASDYQSYYMSDDFEGMLLGDNPAFKNIEGSDNGVLTEQELLDAGFTQDEVDEMMALDGLNGTTEDGQVGINEYEAWAARNASESEAA